MTDPPVAPQGSRRPLSSRDNALIRRLVDLLLRTSVTPNQISLASVVVSAIGAVALALSPGWPVLLLVCAACVQLRLLCNLLDGMVAVEGGRGTPVGALYNEIPDRVADTLFLVAWGHACGVEWLGWATALTAALTAYIRTLGGALGQSQDFRGPMAKQQRMALLTAICVLAFAEIAALGSGVLLLAGLWIALAGSLWTCVARIRAITARLG
jgi:phosphatidylglycerophosphate synthase